MTKIKSKSIPHLLINGNIPTVKKYITRLTNNESMVVSVPCCLIRGIAICSRNANLGRCELLLNGKPILSILAQNQNMIQHSLMTLVNACDEIRVVSSHGKDVTADITYDITDTNYWDTFHKLGLS